MKDKGLEGNIYDLSIKINDHIFNKMNNGEKLTFIDFYLFQATAYALTIIHKNLFMVKDITYSNLFIYRCLIENIAVIQMYREGDIPEDSIELLNDYNKVAEYQIYNKYFNEIAEEGGDASEFGRRFTEAKEKFRNVMKDKTNSEFRKILNSRLPFLLQNYSFKQIVDSYLPNLSEFYGLLSVVAHPHDLYVSRSFFKELNLDSLEEALLLFTLKILEAYDDKRIHASRTLKSELNRVYYNPIAIEYLEIINRQCDSLLKLAHLIEVEGKENYASYLFQEASNTIYLYGVDTMFGLTEVIKAKFKSIVETLAMAEYINQNNDMDNINLNLINMHTRYALAKSINYDDDDYIGKILSEGFDETKKLNPNLNYEEFEKNFKKILGFMNEAESINKLVYKFIDIVCGDDKREAFHVRMAYDEAQILSHANGYMLNANQSAFLASNVVIIFLDQAASYLVNKYADGWTLYNKMLEKKKNKFIYDLNKSRKEFNKYTGEKISYFSKMFEDMVKYYKL